MQDGIYEMTEEELIPFAKGIVLLRSEAIFFANLAAISGIRELEYDFTKVSRFEYEINDDYRTVRLIMRLHILGTVPKEIVNLTKLKKLQLVETALEELPENLGQLPNLEVLNLSAVCDLKSQYRFFCY